MEVKVLPPQPSLLASPRLASGIVATLSRAMAWQLLQQNWSLILRHLPQFSSPFPQAYCPKDNHLSIRLLYSYGTFEKPSFCVHPPPMYGFLAKITLLNQHTATHLCLPFPSSSCWLLLTSPDWSCCNTFLHFNFVDSKIWKSTFSSVLLWQFLTCLSPSYPFHFGESITTTS